MNRRAFLAALLAVPVALRVRPRQGPFRFKPSAAQLRFFNDTSLRTDLTFLRGTQWAHFDGERWRAPGA